VSAKVRDRIVWTGKNTGEVKAWVMSHLLADPVAKEINGPISTFIKRRGSHMTKALWENIIEDCPAEATAALWVAADDQYCHVNDGDTIVKDERGFFRVEHDVPFVQRVMPS